MAAEGKKKRRVKGGTSWAKMTIRVSPETKAMIEKAAEENGLTASEMARCMLEQPTSRKKSGGRTIYADRDQANAIQWQMYKMIDGMDAIRAEMRRIGVNLNQVARAANAKAKLQRLEDELAQVKRTMSKVSASSWMSWARRQEQLEAEIKACRAQMEQTEKDAAQALDCLQQLDQLVRRYEAATHDVCAAVSQVQPPEVMGYVHED